MAINILVAQRPGDGFTPGAIRARELALAFSEPVNVRFFCVLFDAHIEDHRAGDHAPVEQLKEEMITSQQVRLNEAESHLVSICERLDSVVRWGANPVTELLKAATEFNADLIIATVRGHSRLSRLIFSHTDWELARLSSIPILFAQPEKFRPYKKVVTAVDPIHAFACSIELDSEMINAGERLAAPFDGLVFLLNAYPDMHLHAKGGCVRLPEIYAGWERSHRLAVAKLADQNAIEPEQVRLGAGDPRQVISAAVSELDADLVVVGSVSRRDKRRAIGQTSVHVIDSVDCDVLVVRAGPAGRLVQEVIAAK